MARPRPDTPPNLFTGPEIEAGCGLPKRAVEVLKREGLMPEASHEAKRGGQALWSFTALTEMAVAGAIFGGVPSLVLSARLGSAIYGEVIARKGRIPTGFDRFRKAAEIYQPEDWTDEGLDDLKAHARLRQHPEIYQPHKSRPDDFCFYIVDRRYVFSGSTRNIPILSPFGGQSLPVTPEFIIEGWQRGGVEDLAVKGFYSTLPANWADDADDLAQARRLEEVAQAAWEDAINTIAINISLSIRRSLDAIYDIRLEKRGNN